MTDTPLDKLRHLPVPPPREAAREAAIAAAQAAFASAPDMQGEGTAPKETAAVPRPMSATPQTRRPRMLVQRKLTYAMAASLAVVAIGTPLAWQLARQPLPTVASGPTRVAPGVPGVAASGERQPTTPPAAKAPEPVPGLLVIESARKDAPPPAGSPATAGKNDLPAADADVGSAPASQAADRARAERQALAQAEAKAKREAAPQDGRLSALLDKAPAAAPAKPVAPVAKVAPAAPAPAYSEARKALVQGIANQQKAGIDDYRQRQQLGVGQQVTMHHGSGVLLPRDPAPPPTIEPGRDRFPEARPNPLKRVVEEPVSTFSVDVDTASYGLVRRALNGGRLPLREAVRIEEMINYFPYAYPLPESREQPFQPTVTVVPSPWNAGRQLVHIAIKGYAIGAAERPRANLVFLIDTSGSMAGEDRLPLVRNALRLLVGQLRPDDTIGIVTYAGNASAALQPTRVAEKEKVLAAIERLAAGGSTAGAAGLQQAYAMAEAGFDAKAVNRIVLATDGDFNVGLSDPRQLEGFIARKRDTGVYLSILGVGIGNHNDRLMQALAQAGNGVAAYIDTLAEARKVLVEEASSTLFPIARDVKIQIEFNPATVAEYRLVGYETRLLRREDFNNDKVDAGDVGSGHAVTAIYEIAPVGGPVAADPLRYRHAAAPAAPGGDRTGSTRDRELGHLKLRYKLPLEDRSRLIELAIGPTQARPSLAAASEDVRFAIAVAGFGELLKGTGQAGTLTYDEIIALAAGSRGEDPFGYRAELVNLVRLAKSATP